MAYLLGLPSGAGSRWTVNQTTPVMTPSRKKISSLTAANSASGTPDAQGNSAWIPAPGPRCVVRSTTATSTTATAAAAPSAAAETR